MKKRSIILATIFLASVLFLGGIHSAKAIWESQCATGKDGGPQTGCQDRNNYKAILSEQCVPRYTSKNCGSMQAYLDVMAADCSGGNEDCHESADCATLKKSGIYGREAAKFAKCVEGRKVLAGDNANANCKTGADCPSGKCNKDGTCVLDNSTTECENPPCAYDSGNDSFPNPLQYDSLSEVLMAVLINLQSFLAIIAIIMIIIGGIMYMFSAGDEKIVTRAKATIGGALIGLAIILAAPSFLKQIKIVLGGGWKGTNADQVVNQAYTFKDIAMSVMNLLLSLIGILGIISLVIGGVMYLTAYGSDDRIETSKKIIANALIGIFVAFGALILVKQIAALLGR